MNLCESCRNFEGCKLSRKGEVSAGCSPYDPITRADLAAKDAEIDRLRDFVRDVRDGWDCDSDAHKYGTPCRCCLAEKIITEGAQS
jgi:hypothetical protein